MKNFIQFFCFLAELKKEEKEETSFVHESIRDV